MNSVPPRAAAHGHNPISGLRLFAASLRRYRPYRATKNKWIRQVTLIENDGAVDRRDADSIAVITHSSDDSFDDFGGMQHAGGQLFDQCVGWGKAEDIGI